MAWLMAAVGVMAWVSHLSNRGGEEAKPGAGLGTPGALLVVQHPIHGRWSGRRPRSWRFFCISAPSGSRLQSNRRPFSPHGFLPLSRVAAAIWKFRLLAYPWHFSMEAPAGHGNFELLIVTGYLAFPLCALAVYFALAKPRISPFLHGGFAVLLLLAGFSLWGPPVPRPAHDGGEPAAAGTHAADRSTPGRSVLDERAGRALV